MKHFARLSTLTVALLLVACVSSLPKPEQYGFRRTAIKGHEYLCASTEWVVPPVVLALLVPAANSNGDIPFGVVGARYPNAHETCLTQAQWPDWLMLHNTLIKYWPITPAVAQARVSP